MYHSCNVQCCPIRPFLCMSPLRTILSAFAFISSESCVCHEFVVYMFCNLQGSSGTRSKSKWHRNALWRHGVTPSVSDTNSILFTLNEISLVKSVRAYVRVILWRINSPVRYIRDRSFRFVLPSQLLRLLFIILSLCACVELSPSPSSRPLTNRQLVLTS